MAARRIFSLLAPRISQRTLKAVARDFDHPSPKSFSRITEAYARKFQSLAEVPTDNPVESKTCSSSNPIYDESTEKHTVNSSLKVSGRHDLAMIYTCKVCETRSVKTMCRESYDKGVVVVRCDGCNNLHLIADRLGWFGEATSVEDFLAARGEEVKKGSIDTLNFTPDDLAGTKSVLI